MNGVESPSLFEQQVALTRIALGLQRDMAQHLSSQVIPHLDCSAPSSSIEDLMDYLLDEMPLHANLGYLVDGARAQIRRAIKNGTSEEQVAIQRDRMIGGTEAFEARRTLSSNAKALQAALPLIDQFYEAVRNAVEFADAIRESHWMLQNT